MEIVIPLKNLDALQQIHDLFTEKNVSWLVGGSCGLLLQGVALAQTPRDLDLYVDMETAQVVHEALQTYATDQLLLSQTEIYKSLLSHYLITNVPIEVVGGFEVHAHNSHYQVEVNGFLDAFGVSYDIKGRSIGVMPLAHELVFNILRERPDRYMAIAAVMRLDPSKYLTPLNKIMERNTFSTEFVNKLNELLSAADQ